VDGLAYLYAIAIAAAGRISCSSQWGVIIGIRIFEYLSIHMYFTSFTLVACGLVYWSFEIFIASTMSISWNFFVNLLQNLLWNCCTIYCEGLCWNFWQFGWMSTCCVFEYLSMRMYREKKFHPQLEIGINVLVHLTTLFQFLWNFCTTYREELCSLCYVVTQWRWKFEYSRGINTTMVAVVVFSSTGLTSATLSWSGMGTVTIRRLHPRVPLR